MNGLISSLFRRRRLLFFTVWLRGRLGRRQRNLIPELNSLLFSIVVVAVRERSFGAHLFCVVLNRFLVHLTDFSLKRFRKSKRILVYANLPLRPKWRSLFIWVSICVEILPDAGLFLKLFGSRLSQRLKHRELLVDADLSLWLFISTCVETSARSGQF